MIKLLPFYILKKMVAFKLVLHDEFRKKKVRFWIMPNLRGPQHGLGVGHKERKFIKLRLIVQAKK